MNAGYVYVLAFDNGTVKVGRTQNTSQRLSAHKSEAGKFGVTLTDHWVSPPHTEWMRNEDKLKAIAAGLGGTVHRREYFRGVDYAEVLAAAEQLTFTPPAEEVAAPEVAAPPKANAARKPHDSINAGYIYVAVRDGDIISVDQTTSPTWLIPPPDGTRRSMITDAWVSPLHLEWLWNLDSLREIVTRIGGVSASPYPDVPADHPAVRAYFSGVSLDAIRPAAERLTFTPPPPGWERPPLPKFETREAFLAYVGREFLRLGVDEAQLSEMAADMPIYAEMAAATAQEMIRDARSLLAVAGGKAA